MHYLLTAKESNTMWFKKGKTKTEQTIRDIHAATFESIDRATAAIDRNTENLEKLNKALEQRGDVAYNVFVATGGLRRQQASKRKKQ